MIQGFHVSRKTKINLHHEALKRPTDTNLSKYKTYGNLYDKLLRACRKLYFVINLNKAKKTQKNMGTPQRSNELNHKQS